jgi:hypothetical protein
VHKEHLEKNFQELQVLKLRWKEIRERLVRQLLEEQDKVFRCYYAAKWGGQAYTHTNTHVTHTRRE